MGAGLATVCLYWGYYAYRTATGRPMPPWHWDVAAKPALLTGEAPAISTQGKRVNLDVDDRQGPGYFIIK